MSSDPTPAARGRRRRETPLGHAVARQLLRWLCRNASAGHLVAILPSGGRIEHRGTAPGPVARIGIKRWSLIRRLVIGGHLGFAEAYLAGDFDTPDLRELLHWALANQASMSRIWNGTPFARALAWLGHAGRRNTPKGSRRNISAHYDLGNAFYREWLDAGMNYSSALFSRRDQSLEAAQMAKTDRVAALLEPDRGDRVLEIGCGWGALAERLVDRHGCHVTGITLSHEQLAYARTRLASAGPLADIRLEDYRDVTGPFDRIASIEMIEAVGEAYWPRYFGTIARALKPGGIAVLQVITIDENMYAPYRRNPDFIQKYIFPGGMLPTKTIMREQIDRAGMALRHTEHFGASYAQTIAAWHERFLAAWPRLRTLGFDDAFRRRWEYYFAYCEAGFAAGMLDVGLYRIEHGVAG